MSIRKKTWGVSSPDDLKQEKARAESLHNLFRAVQNSGMDRNMAAAYRACQLQLSKRCGRPMGYRRFARLYFQWCANPSPETLMRTRSYHLRKYTDADCLAVVRFALESRCSVGHASEALKASGQMPVPSRGHIRKVCPWSGALHFHAREHARFESLISTDEARLQEGKP